MNSSGYKLIMVAVVAAAFVVALVWASRNYRVSRLKAKEITVTGNAEKNISSDVIAWSAAFQVSTKDDIQSAYHKIATDRKTLEEFLAQNGVPDSAITFESVIIEKDRDYQLASGEYVPVFNGYNLRQEVRIISHDIDLVERVSRDISQLLDKGLYILSTPPSYYYSLLEESKHELLEMASRDALMRAESIAKGSNRTVGKLLRSQMGVFQIVGLYSNEDYSWGGNFNTSSREKTISVTVKNSYALR